jgi:hypothetical protein
VNEEEVGECGVVVLDGGDDDDDDSEDLSIKRRRKRMLYISTMPSSPAYDAGALAKPGTIIGAIIANPWSSWEVCEAEAIQPKMEPSTNTWMTMEAFTHQKSPKAYTMQSLAATGWGRKKRGCFRDSALVGLGNGLIGALGAYGLDIISCPIQHRQRVFW